MRTLQLELIHTVRYDELSHVGRCELAISAAKTDLALVKVDKKYVRQRRGFLFAAHVHLVVDVARVVDDLLAVHRLHRPDTARRTCRPSNQLHR